MPVAEERRGRVADRRDAAILGDHGQLERESAVGRPLADPVEKAQVLGEAAERDVLAVVGRRLGIALARGERLNRAAERRPRLVEGDVAACVHELERSREPSQAAADDRSSHRRSPDPAIRSFVSADRCGGPAKTS